MRTKKNISVLLCILTLGFNHCSTDLSKDTRTVFNYNEHAGITSLDPAMANNTENIWPVNQLFNGLVQLNDSLDIKPCISKSWTIAADGLEYQFLINTKIQFHHNACFNNRLTRNITASDVAYSFNRLNNPAASAALSYVSNINILKHGGYQVINDSIIIIHLIKPNTSFLKLLTMAFFSIIPKEAVEYYGTEWRRNPVGTGPFMFKYWEEGTKLVLHKNSQYFEFENNSRLPYLDAVTISFVKDKETAFMEFITGKHDMLSGADAFNINEVLDAQGQLKAKYQPNINLQKAPYLKVDYLGFLIDTSISIVKQSPTKLKKIRQAINYAIDRKKIIKNFRNNIGTPALGGFIPKGFACYDFTIGYNYNPQKCQALLAEAGFENGKKLPTITLQSTENYIEQLEYIQAQLAEQHIAIKINIEKSPVLRQMVNNNQSVFFKKSWIADYADEENALMLFYSAFASPQGSNYTHYKNPLFDSIYLKSLETIDISKKYQYYKQLDKMLIDDAPCVILYYDEVIRLVQKNIENLKPNPMNLLNLKRVKKTFKNYKHEE